MQLYPIWNDLWFKLEIACVDLLVFFFLRDYILFSIHFCCFAALREDWYYIAGRAIAISLVHGGPPPNFLSLVLFSLLIDVPANPVPEDIADADLLEKVKKVSCHSFFPHQDRNCRFTLVRPHVMSNVIPVFYIEVWILPQFNQINLVIK